MITTNIKDYSDEDIAVLIRGLQNGDIPYSLNDLKKLLSEVNNRKLDSKYINVLTSLMHGEIVGARAEAPSDALPRRRTENKETAAEADCCDDEEYERFPMLAFLSGLYRVLAWFFFAVIIVGSAVGGFVYFRGDILYIICTMIGGIMLGTVNLVFFYAQSEKILLQLEIEEHLRNMCK